LLDAITQAHSTAHMEQNATRIIPLPDSLLPGTFFFHPFMDFYIFHREPVGLLGFFCGLIFFSLQPSIGGIWVYFWDLYLFRVWLCWNWHIPSDTSNAISRGQECVFSVLGVIGVILDLYFFLVELWSHFKTRFSLLARWGCQVFWTCNFSRDLVPGTCVLFRIWMCSTWHLSIFTVFVPTLLYPSIYLLPINYLHVFSSIIGYCLEYRLNTGPLNLESDALTTEPWSCERM
jgi:hypothetical protein